MRHKTKTRSSLFLMELIIAILFFSLASAVCLRLYAKSHQLSTDASARNQAVNQTGNVAELIKYDLENGTRTLAEKYPDADIITANSNRTNADAKTVNIEDMYSGSVIYFDKNWDACSVDQAEYKLIIQAQDSSATLRKYMLSMYSLSEETADVTVSSDSGGADSNNSGSDNDTVNSDAVNSGAVNSGAVDSGAGSDSGNAASNSGSRIYELPLSIHIAREVAAHE